jgi:hypothetical protein
MTGPASNEQGEKAPADEDRRAQIRAGIVMGEVGYGRPPEHTRFRKGRSGNPGGRRSTAPPELPIESQETRRYFLDYMDSKIQVRENGALTWMTVREACIRALVAKGLGGGQRSQAEIMHFDERWTRERALEVRRETEFWEAYCADASAAIAEARAARKPLPKFLPHPKDIRFEAGKPPRIIGPFDAESERKALETMRHVEQLLLQHELDERRLCGKATTSIFDVTGAAYVCAIVFNHALPPSLRLSDGDIEWRLDKARRIATRKLLKDVYRGWRALGVPFRRGQTSASASHALNRFKQIHEIIEQLRDKDRG